MKLNQLKLYVHFKKLLENPNPNNLKGIDKDFVIKQAKESILSIEKVYPEFLKKK